MSQNAGRKEWVEKKKEVKSCIYKEQLDFSDAHSTPPS